MSPNLAVRRTELRDGTVIVRHKDKGALHRLLLRACPPNAKGEKSITILANRLKLSAWAVHKWCNKGHISPNRARDVVDVADPESGITLTDFSPFFYD